MTREEFIGKLRSIYVGEENAIDEIISEYDIQKRTIQYLSECINEKDGLIIEYREEIDRLNEELGDANYTITQLHKVMDRHYVKKEDYDRLNNIIDTMLEFGYFKEECPLNFGFGDEKEEKAQDVFYEDEWCENNCDDNYKKCWLKYFAKLKALKEDNK